MKYHPRFLLPLPAIRASPPGKKKSLSHPEPEHPGSAAGNLFLMDSLRNCKHDHGQSRLPHILPASLRHGKHGHAPPSGYSRNQIAG